LEKEKEVFIECKTCLEVKNENEKLKDEIFKLDKFKDSSNSLKKIISVQETLGDKTGLGFTSTNVSTCENKNGKFECESSKQKPLDSKPKYVPIKDRKIPIASDEEVKSFYKPSLKAKTGFSKLKLRSKTPPPNRPNILILGLKPLNIGEIKVDKTFLIIVTQCGIFHINQALAHGEYFHHTCILVNCKPCLVQTTLDQ
jgi:hypothetical protein